MSELRANITEAHYRINGFLGVNEAPDGDTHIKTGEAAVMRNWRVTDSGSLKRRPGTRKCIGLLEDKDNYVLQEGPQTAVYKDMNVNTRTLDVYSSATTTDNGGISLGGTEATASYSDIAGEVYVDDYFQDGNKVYRVKGVARIREGGIGGEFIDGGWVWPVTWSQTYYGGDTSTSTSPPDAGLTKVFPYHATLTGARNGYLSMTGKDTDTPLNDLISTVSNDNPIYRWKTNWSYGYTDAKNASYDSANEAKVIYEITSITKAVVPAGTDSDGHALYRWRYTLSGRELTWSGDAVYYWYAAPVSVAPLSGTNSVKALWTGYVGGNKRMVAACGGRLWKLTESNGDWSKAEIYNGIDTSGPVCLFGMDDNLYCLDGTGYYVWDGTNVSSVSGYAPVVVTAAAPDGSGQTLERVNMLTRRRRKRFSADGTSTYYLEPDLDENTPVSKVTVNGAAVANYTVYPTTGAIVFSSPLPPAGSNNIEVTYTVSLTQHFSFAGNGSSTVFEVPVDPDEIDQYEGTTVNGVSQTGVVVVGNVVTLPSAPANGASVVVEMTFKDPRDKILTMKYAEFFNGSNDNRVFLYGNGGNKTYYSGIDEYGKGRADYFPDLNEIEVGDNSPITAMCRHYSRLLIFKSQSAYSVYYDMLALADGSVTEGFYLSSVNRVVGCDAMGQAQLVENKVRTPDGSSIYEWAATSSGGVIINDQRNAKRISQRVEVTVGGFDLTQCVTFFDKIKHEYWVCYGGTCAVHNTELDAWSVYTGLYPTCFALWNDELYYGADDSFLRHVSDVYTTDDYASGIPSMNMLPDVYHAEKTYGQSYLRQGITWTLNGDGSITANGGPAEGSPGSAYAVSGRLLTAVVGPVVLDPRKSYTLSGCPAGGSANSYSLRIQYFKDGEPITTNGGTIVSDNGSGVTITGARYGYVYCRLKNGYTADNITFYPMLVEGDTAHEYQSTHNGDLNIPCTWESGSLDFDRPWVRKYSAELWLILKKGEGGSVRAGFLDDENGSGEKTLYTDSPYIAHTKRARLKSRNNSHYKLTIESGEGTPATVEGAVIAVKYAANIKRGPDI